MTLSWTVLGAGTASPHPERSPSGHLLEAPQGPVLIDMGPGTLWRLSRAGVHWSALRAIFLSHAHLDHLLDLPALMFAARAEAHGRTAPLPIHVGPGLTEHVERLHGALGRWFEPLGFEVQWVTLRRARVEVAGLTVELAPVVHHATSLGMRFEHPDGGVVAYSGDSDLCDSLIELCRGADLAVLECSSAADHKLPGHMTPREVAEVSRRAGAARVALVHRYPELDGVDVAAQVTAHGFAGQVMAAEDGTRFEVGPGGVEHDHGQAR